MVLLDNDIALSKSQEALPNMKVDSCAFQLRRATSAQRWVGRFLRLACLVQLPLDDATAIGRLASMN
jgi:hypothetical protein